MAHDPQHLTDTYKEGFCSVCGISGVNQYYGIKQSFIDYCGNIHTFTEMLRDLLSLGNLSQLEENDMEMCQDCKDKLVKFYHFKRKAHEVQHQLKRSVKKVLKSSQKNNEHTTSYQEDQSNEKNSFKILSAVSLINEEIAIKEEKEEAPNIVFTGYSSDFSMPDTEIPEKAQRKYNPWNRGNGDKPLSKAALKMRIYRERLKLPENRHRFLKHQKQQREYNRRHYQRKQGSGENSRHSNEPKYNQEEDDDDDYDEDLFILP